VTERRRHTPPQPSENIRGKNGYPCASGNTGEGFFGAWLSVRETIAADHDRNQTCDLGDGSSKEGLNGGKSGIER
jgi:hypothetical protein